MRERIFTGKLFPERIRGRASRPSHTYESDEKNCTPKGPRPTLYAVHSSSAKPITCMIRSKSSEP